MLALCLAAVTYVHATIGGTVATRPAEFDHLLFWSTVASIAVALFTLALAISTFVLARETKQSIDVSQAGLRLELVREARVVAPLVVAAITPILEREALGSNWRMRLQLTNKGSGVAMKLRFSGVAQRGKIFGAADYVQSPLSP